MLIAFATRTAIAGAYLLTLFFPAPLDTIAALIAVAVLLVWASAVLTVRRSKRPAH
jgi:hypothetical protein